MNKFAKIACFIFIFIFAFMGVMGIVLIFDQPQTKEDIPSLSKVDAGDLKKNDYYLMENAKIYGPAYGSIDTQHSSGALLSSTDCYLIVFQDSSGKDVVASFTAPKNADCQSELSQIASSNKVSSISLSGYVKITDVLAEIEGMGSVFTESLLAYSLNGMKYDSSSVFVFNYVCNVDGNPLENEANPIFSGIIMFVVCTGLSVLIFFLYKRAQKKAAAATANIQPPPSFVFPYGQPPANSEQDSPAGPEL